MSSQTLSLHQLVEDPDLSERIITEKQLIYSTDTRVRHLLESTYLEPDRSASFERFYESYEFLAIKTVLSIFGVGTESKVCEIGGGPGFLAWALSRSGFSSVQLLEPNSLFNTGTGYLQSREDSGSLIVHNDLHGWHSSPDRFDTVLTRNCIHHFKNITQAAATIRQKMAPDGVWIAFREWYAETPQELYARLSAHPYCQPYGVYEWPYPAWHYIEAIELAGFTLKAVIPAGYANNALSDYQESPGTPENQKITQKINEVLKRDPSLTVKRFWREVLNNRLRRKSRRLFSRPQGMVFTVVPY